MRKALAALAAVIGLLLIIPVLLIASGTIDSSSIPMMLNVMTGVGGPAADESTIAGRYRVAEGFSISLYSADLPRARFMHVTAGGDLLVSRPHAGDIVLLKRDADGDGRPDGRDTLLSDLKRPLGLDTHNGWLYVAESHRVGRWGFDANAGRVTGAYEPLVEGLTDNGNHWSKTLRIGPNAALYLAQGSTCNICEEDDERRATMMRFNLDGSGGEIIATGLRNSVGFDWAPWSGELYATDNGRDLLGDDFPPCELNHIEAGKFYGWPYFNGDNLPDPDMGPDPRAGEREPTAPAHGFRAHNAPLGIHFLNADKLPAEFQRSALVALHGSWNRSEPDGYKVVSLHFTDNGIEERDFLWGLNIDGDILGRPVDIAQGPGGEIYISDDYAGAIYRVDYGSPQSGSADLAAALGSTRGENKQTPPDWLASANISEYRARGAALYTQYGCAECHEQGENPKRLDNLGERLGYDAVIDALRAPQAPMPVYPLSEEEQRQLAVYLLQVDAQAPQ